MTVLLNLKVESQLQVLDLLLVLSALCWHWRLLVLQLNLRLQVACMLLVQVLSRLLLYLMLCWRCVRLVLDVRLIALVVR